MKNIEIRRYDCRTDSDGMYILSFDNQVHLKCSLMTKNILDTFDGVKSNDMVRMELEKKGIHMSQEDLKKFVCDIISKYNLDKNSEKEVKMDRKGNLWFHIPLVESKRFSGLNKILSYLFHKLIVYGIVGLTAILLVYDLYCLLTREMSGENNSILLLFLLYGSVLFHEFGHIAAAKRCGVEVGKIGIGMYLFTPVFFVDMKEVWRLPKNKRILVDIGGCYFQMIYMDVVLLYGIISKENIYIWLGMMIFLITIVNIFPFLKLDGYWILTDFLDKNNISLNAVSVVVFCIKERIKNKKFKLKRKEFIYFCYCCSYLVFTIIMLGAGVVMCVEVFQNYVYIINEFKEIYSNFVIGSIGTALGRLNDILIYILPCFYLIVMLIVVLKKIIKSFYLRINEKEKKKQCWN